MKAQRPKSILWFNWLFWGAYCVGYIGEILFEKRNLDFLWLDIVVLGFVILCWYSIALRASNIFRWIYAILTFISISLWGLAVVANRVELALFNGELLGISSMEFGFGAIVNVLSLGATICLFLKSSRIWFRSKGEFVEEAAQLTDVFK